MRMFNWVFENMSSQSVRKGCVVTKNLYFIYKCIKMVYALLVKSNKYIKTHRPTNVCIFDSWRSLFIFIYRLYVIYLGNNSVQTNIFTWKQNINYNVHNLNGNFLHIQILKIFGEKKCSIISLTLGLVGNIFFLGGQP